MRAARERPQQDRVNAAGQPPSIVQPPPMPPFRPQDDPAPVDEPRPVNDGLGENFDVEDNIEEGIQNMGADEAVKKQKLHPLLNDLVHHQTALVSFDIHTRSTTHDSMNIPSFAYITGSLVRFHR